MRISDWSSDVCSSDLRPAAGSASEPGASTTTWEGSSRQGGKQFGGPRAAAGGGGGVVGDLSQMLARRCQVALAQRQRRQQLQRGGAVGRFRHCQRPQLARSEEHTSELQSLMRNSYAVFCL